jgi:hypothetical protein
MSVIPDPNKFYRSLLAMARLEVSEEGLVSEISDDGEKLPFFVGDKRLVIPEPGQLRASFGNERVFFQAARENIMLGETKEFAVVRKRINERMQIRIMAMLAELLVLAGSPKLQPKLKGKQLELLRGLEEMDKEAKNILSMYKDLLAVTAQGDATQQPFSLYLNKNGKLGTTGHSYRRIAVVSFPLYEQLVKDGIAREEIMARRKEQPKETRDDLPDNATFGVKLGKHGRQIFTRVFEYIFPMIATKDAYSMGSNSDYFPYLEAFCLSMQNVAECVNNVIDTFVDVVPSLEGLRIDLSWVDAIANPDGLHKAAQQVPDQNMGGAVHGASQPSHQGAIPIAQEVAAPPPPVAPGLHGVTPTQVAQQVAPAPATTQTQQQPQTGHRIQEKSLADLFTGQNQRQPVMQPQGMVPGLQPMGNQMFQVPPAQPQGRVYMGGGMPGMPGGMGAPGMMQPQGMAVPPGYVMTPQGLVPVQQTTGMNPGVMMGQPPGFGKPGI